MKILKYTILLLLISLFHNTRAGDTIGFSNYSVECINYSAHIHWLSFTDNKSYFVLKRTQDGSNYDILSNIKDTINNFSFVDKNPLNGISYYTVSQYDDYGNIFSKTIVYQSCANDEFLNVSNTDKSINVTVESNTKSKYIFKILNSLGQTVSNFTKNIVEGLNVYRFPINLNKGVYTIVINNDDKNYIRKVIII